MKPSVLPGVDFTAALSISKMEILAQLSFVLCAVSVASQSQQTATMDCAPLFEACDQEYEASQKDMVQVNDYYHCLKRPLGCDFVQEEDRERRIVQLKRFVANVCPSCRLGDKIWATPTESPDETPMETCEDQIFTCTTHKSDSMTHFDMLQEAFVCVQRPRECSAHEEYLRLTVSNAIITEMALACPHCLVPNVPPSMYMTHMDPENMTCMSVLTLCNAKFNIKESSYWSFESLYMCIAKISNCENDIEKTLRQQQMDVLVMTLKGMCPNCTMPTPTPPSQHTCLESVYYCSTHGIDESFTVRHNALRKVHECALELDKCHSADDNNLRFYLVHQVRMEMKWECGHCDMPHVPADFMAAIENAMQPDYHMNCMEAITSCQTIFNIRRRGQRRYEEMYHCVQMAESCTPEDMERMEQMTVEMEHPLRRRKRSAPSSVIFKPLPPPKLEVKESSPCYYDIIGCQQEFQMTPGSCRNRLAYLTCLTTIRNCRVLEEQTRMQYISEQYAVIQKECMLSGIHSDYAERPGVSCYTSFMSCSQRFYSSPRHQRHAKQFYQCLGRPQGCNDWEESYRREMLQTALNYLPSPGTEHEHTSSGTLLSFHGVTMTSLTLLVWMLIQSG